MSSLIIKGDTSGAVELAAPAAAGNPTITLPTTSYTMFAPQADQWCVTSDFSVNNTEQIINANLSRVNNFTVVGSGMTQSSGIFTFPTTGTYLVQYNISGFYTSTSQSYNNAIYIYLTTNNNSFSDIARSAFNLYATNNLTRFGAFASTMVNILDTTNYKVRFSVYMSGNMTVQGAGPGVNSCGFSFIRLG